MAHSRVVFGKGRGEAGAGRLCRLDQSSKFMSEMGMPVGPDGLRLEYAAERSVDGTKNELLAQ